MSSRTVVPLRSAGMDAPASWRDDVEGWAVAQRAAGRSSETIALRRYHLTRLATWAAPRRPEDLTLDDLLHWLGERDWSRETLRSYRASVRGFYRWAVATGRVAVDPAAGLPPVAPAQPRPRPAPPTAVVTALREADQRVWLMIRLGVEVGLRRGEVARVHSRDVLDDLGGWSLRVHGKGARERTVPLPDSLARALRRLPEGYAFPGADDGHLSARWVGRLVSRMLPEGVTMHALRHLCATELHDEHRDLRAVQRLLGHASVATTERYVAVRDETVRRMVDERSRRWTG